MATLARIANSLYGEKGGNANIHLIPSGRIKGISAKRRVGLTSRAIRPPPRLITTTPFGLRLVTRVSISRGRLVQIHTYARTYGTCGRRRELIPLVGSPQARNPEEPIFGGYANR